MSPRILVTISRRWKRWSLARAVMTEIHRIYPDAVLMHGDCPDGDRTLAGIWRSLGGEDEPWPADWARYGKAAGKIRSARMVEQGPIACVSFIRNRSAGATYCTDLAEGAGIKTYRYAYEEEL